MTLSEWIRSKISRSEYHLSEHVVRAMTLREVSLAQIENALKVGRVIETHSHPLRPLGFLLLSGDRQHPLHVFLSRQLSDNLLILLAYIPRPPLWADPTTRSPQMESSMSHDPPNCFFCQGEIETIKVGNFDYRLEGQLYVLKNIPAGLCRQCGEKYISAPVAQRINQLILADTPTRKEEVLVIDYSDEPSGAGL